MKKKLFKFSIFFSLFLPILGTAGCSKPDDSKEKAENPPIEKKEKSIPQLEATKVSVVSRFEAYATGKITETGEANITEKGFVWGQSENPTQDDFYIVSNSQNSFGLFSENLRSLSPNRTYFVRSYAINEIGLGYGKETSFSTSYQMEQFLDPNSFATEEKFFANWEMFYPWGTDHNGSARMRQENVSLEEGGILRIEANRISPGTEPESNWVGQIPFKKRDPWENHPDINYYSGAIFFNKTISLNNGLPYWIIKGEFQMPTVQGAWPAFKLVDASASHNLITIVEFQGSNTARHNFIGNNDDSYYTSTNIEKKIPDASNKWHEYKIILNANSLVDNIIITEFYIDGELVEDWQWIYDTGPMLLNLIIHLQMEGASGSPGPETAVMKARNISVSVDPKNF